MDVIDGKSAVLLTHVLVMLAVVVGILFAVSDDSSSLFTLVLQAKVVLYAIVAMFLIRCIDVMGPPFKRNGGEPEQINVKYRNEILVRERFFS